MAPSSTGVFELCDTSVVSDALDEHGIDGVLRGLTPVDPEQTVVGRAHTLSFEEAETRTEQTNFPYAMLNELVEERVLVVDGVGPDVSCWGGNAARLAANAGVSGVVIDGGYRDVPEIRESAFPVFGRAPTPTTGQGRVRVAAVGDPVDVGGVSVRSDDIVVADATGVVVVPADDADAVAETAEDILAEELLLAEKIEHGATVDDLQQDGHQF
jgi:regulator of RNase E activity RraA